MCQILPMLVINASLNVMLKCTVHRAAFFRIHLQSEHDYNMRILLGAE